MFLLVMFNWMNFGPFSVYRSKVHPILFLTTLRLIVSTLTRTVNGRPIWPDSMHQQMHGGSANFQLALADNIYRRAHSARVSETVLALSWRKGTLAQCVVERAALYPSRSGQRLQTASPQSSAETPENISATQYTDVLDIRTLLFLAIIKIFKLTVCV